MSLRAPTQRHNWHDAYDAQMALWRWYRTLSGQAYMQVSYREHLASLPDDDPGTRDLLLTLYSNEMSRLLDCDPIYVSADMCELIGAAADGFQPEPLLETDLITPRGFLLFETPFEIPDRFDEPTTIQAVSWTRVFRTPEFGQTLDQMREQAQEAGISIETAGDHGHFRSSAPSRALVEEFIEQLGGEAYGLSLTLYATSEREQEYVAEGLRHGTPVPVVIPLHLTPWYFGMTFDGNEVDVHGRPTGAAWWWRLVQTTLRLMQQRVAHKELYRPDRAARREARKLGIPDETQVVVVRLRREQQDSHEPVERDVNWSHRWIVGGHWRNQPYKGGIIRQIWISPHVKGPPDKPLVVKPRRVYQWNR